MNNTTLPHRIQRRRTRGWKNPPHTKYVGRPSNFGNPFVVGKKFQNLAIYIAITNKILPPDEIRAWYDKGGLLIETPRQAVEWYEKYLAWCMKTDALFKWKVERLRGWNLSCFCPLDQVCHVDVLLRVANQ